MPQVRRPDRAGDLRAGRPVQGIGMVRHRLRQEVLHRLGFTFFERRFGFEEGCQIERRLLQIRKFFKVGEFKRELEREFERGLEEIRRLLKEEVVWARAPRSCSLSNSFPSQTPAESFSGVSHLKSRYNEDFNDDHYQT